MLTQTEKRAILNQLKKHDLELAKMQVTELPAKAEKTPKTALNEAQQNLKLILHDFDTLLQTISTDPTWINKVMEKVRKQENGIGLGYSLSGLQFFRSCYAFGKEAKHYGMARSFLRAFMTKSEQKSMQKGGLINIFKLVKAATKQVHVFKGLDRRIIGFPEYLALFSAGLLTTKETDEDGFNYVKLVRMNQITPEQLAIGEKVLSEKIAKSKLFDLPLPKHILEAAKNVGKLPEPKR